jgi:hypothetical protein
MASHGRVGDVWQPREVGWKLERIMGRRPATMDLDVNIWDRTRKPVYDRC